MQNNDSVDLSSTNFSSNTENHLPEDSELAPKQRRKRGLPDPVPTTEVAPEMKKQRRQQASQRVAERLESVDKISAPRQQKIKPPKEVKQLPDAVKRPDLVQLLANESAATTPTSNIIRIKRTDEEEEEFRRRSAERKREERSKRLESTDEREAMRAKEAARKRQERARKLLKDPNLREKLALQKRAYRERKAEEKRAWAVLMALAAAQGKT